MLKLQFMMPALICFLLSLSPNDCLANDYYIDFIGSTVIITSNDMDTPVVVNVDHLISDDGEADVNLIVNTVLNRMKQEKKYNMRKNNVIKSGTKDL